MSLSVSSECIPSPTSSFPKQLAFHLIMCVGDGSVTAHRSVPFSLTATQNAIRYMYHFYLMNFLWVDTFSLFPIFCKLKQLRNVYP